MWGRYTRRREIQLSKVSEIAIQKKTLGKKACVQKMPKMASELYSTAAFIKDEGVKCYIQRRKKAYLLVYL